jgi:hypothetical protein
MIMYLREQLALVSTVGGLQAKLQQRGHIHERLQN